MTDRNPGWLQRMTTYITTEWMPEYDKLMATLTALGQVEQPPNILPVARLWWEAGIPGKQAVEWFAAGFAPADAARLIAAGATPTTAKEAELAALDAADGGTRLAGHRHLRQLLDDAVTTAEMDPDNPGVVTLHLDEF